MWSKGEKVKTAVRTKPLAGITRLNSSSIEAESQNTLEAQGDKTRKPNLPVAVWCIPSLPFFTHRHHYYDDDDDSYNHYYYCYYYYVCFDWILWGLATQVTQKRTFWKRCSDISSSVGASLTLPHSFVIVYWALSSLPLRINKDFFDIQSEYFVSFLRRH